MKKIVVVMAIILLLTACNSKSNIVIDHNVKSKYFKIADNYKKGISGFYVVNNQENRIDTKEVELGLMQISSGIYNPSNSYYQNGQYLKRDDLKKIIDNLNKQLITINKKEYQLPLVAYIYETNYVTQGDKLKGMALAIAINNTQIIDGVEVTLNTNDIKRYLEKNDALIMDVVRKKEDLENIKVVIGVFGLNKKESPLPGRYLMSTSTRNNNINNFKLLNNNKYIMNSEALKQLDEINYKNYYTLETELRSKYNSLLINGLGTYEENNLTALDVEINVGALSISSIMSIGQDVINQVNRYFDNKNVKVIVKNDNNDQAFIIFDDLNKNGSIYLLP